MSAGRGIRIGRVLLASTLLLGVLATREVAMPGSTVACDCAVPPPGQPLFDGTEPAVFLGTVGADNGTGIFNFEVARWFKGAGDPVVRLASGTQQLPDGSFMTNMCGFTLVHGSRLLVVASLSDGQYSPSICGRTTDTSGPAGQQVIAAAVATFGQGVDPRAPPAVDAGNGGGIDLAAVAIVLVLAVVVGGALLIVSASFLQRDPTKGAH